MESYVDIVKNKLTSYNENLIKEQDKINKLKKTIHEYVEKESFPYYDFVNNNYVLNAIRNLVLDEDLSSRFESVISKLKQRNYVGLFTPDKDKKDDEKQDLLNVLRDIEQYLSQRIVLHYSELEKKLASFDDVGKVIIPIKDFQKMFKRLGLTDNEILNFNAYVVKQNMNVYDKEKKKIDSETLKLEEQIIEKSLKKESKSQKKRSFKNVKSMESKELLQRCDKVLGNLKNVTKEDENMALSYRELLIDDASEVVDMLFDTNLVLKYLMINISNISTYIKEKESYLSEEDLQDKLKELKKLIDSYEKISSKVSQKTYVDKDDDEKRVSDVINVHYVINSKTNLSYFEEDIKENKNAMNYESDANNLIKKIKNGNIKSKKINNIPRIPNCFYVQQGLTYLSYIILSDDNYLVLTSSMWKDLFNSTNNIYDTEQEQINEIKNNVIGGSKWKSN